MSLYFRNSTPNTIFFCFVHRANPVDCPEGYGKRGWFRLAPGATELAWVGSARRVRSYYAEDNFGHVWSENDPITHIPNSAFTWCLNRRCSPTFILLRLCRSLGFRTILSLEEDLILELTLTSNRRTSKLGNVRIELPTKRKLKYRKYSHGIINKTKRQGRLK